MVVMFEPIVRDETLADRLPGPAWVFLAGVREYIEGRLMPLKDAIEMEEAKDTEEKPRCIMVRFNPGGIMFANYTEGLKKKMHGSFDNLERDIQVMWMKIDNNLRDILGENN